MKITGKNGAAKVSHKGLNNFLGHMAAEHGIFDINMLRQSIKAARLSPGQFNKAMENFATLPNKDRELFVSGDYEGRIRFTSKVGKELRRLSSGISKALF